MAPWCPAAAPPAAARCPPRPRRPPALPLRCASSPNRRRSPEVRGAHQALAKGGGGAPAFLPDLQAPERSRGGLGSSWSPRAGAGVSGPRLQACTHFHLSVFSCGFCLAGAAQSELWALPDPCLASEPTQPWHLCLASASALSPTSVLSWLRSHCGGIGGGDMYPAAHGSGRWTC